VRSSWEASAVNCFCSRKALSSRAKVEFNTAVNGLRTAERAELANGVSGVAARAQSPEELTGALDSIVESKKDTPEYENYQKIAGTMKQAITHLSDKSKGANPVAAGKEPWRQGALNMGASILPASATVGPGGVATPTAGTIATGGGVQPGVTAPALAGGGFTPSGSAVPMTIPPGWQMYEDPVTHNKYMLNQQTGESRQVGKEFKGNEKPPATAGAEPTAPKLSSAPPQQAPGEAEAQQAQVATNWTNHQANITGAAEANQQRDQIHKVIDLLNTGVSTGSGAQALAQSEQIASQIPGLGGLAGPGSKTEKLDLLNKFLERIGAQFGTVTGAPPHTDAGAAALRAQIGSTGYGNAALTGVMKYTDAKYSAAQAKDRAEQQFFGEKGNSILNQHEFEKKWRTNYEHRVYQLANEPQDVADEALAQMKKADPKGYAAFVRKYQALKQLGAAPQ